MFSGQTSNGQSATVSWTGGSGFFRVWGTFGGASVRLQASFDGSEWFDIVAHAAKGISHFTLPSCALRADLSGASGTTALSAAVA